MLVGLSGCAHPLNKNGVLSSRSTDCQLIKSQNGATSFKDASTSAFSDTQSETVILGIVKILGSSVTVPTTTAILSSRPAIFMNLASRATDSGGRWIFDMNKRFKMIRLNLLLVRLAKNLYNLTRSRKYTSSDLGSRRTTFRSYLWQMSIPME